MTNSLKKIDHQTNWGGVYQGSRTRIFATTPQNITVEKGNFTTTIQQVSSGAWKFVFNGQTSIGFSFKYPDGSKTLELVDIGDYSTTNLVVKKLDCNSVISYQSNSKEASVTGPSFQTFGNYRRI